MLTKPWVIASIVIGTTVPAFNPGYASGTEVYHAIRQLTVLRDEVWGLGGRGTLPVDQATTGPKRGHDLLDKVVVKHNDDGIGVSGGRNDHAGDVVVPPNVQRGLQRDSLGEGEHAPVNRQEPPAPFLRGILQQGPGHEPGWEWSSGGSSSGP